jgi:hypothetical protein
MNMGPGSVYFSEDGSRLKVYSHGDGTTFLEKSGWRKFWRSPMTRLSVMLFQRESRFPDLKIDISKNKEVPPEPEDPNNY